MNFILLYSGILVGNLILVREDREPSTGKHVFCTGRKKK